MCQNSSGANAPESTQPEDTKVRKPLWPIIDVLSDFTRDFLGIRNWVLSESLRDIKMKEKKFSAWLRTKLPGIFQRVETTTGPGVPDIWWGMTGGFSCWIETKVVTHKRVLLRKEQWAWMMRAKKENHPVIILALDADTNTILIHSNKSITIEPYNKYLAITSPPRLRISKRAFNYGLLLEFI